MAITAFAAVLYAVPGEWIALLSPLRLALFTSLAAAGLLAVRRLGKMEPISFDGARGVSLIAFVALAVASAGWSVNAEVSRIQGLELVKLGAIYLTLINVVTTARRLAIVCAAMVFASIVTSIGALQWYATGIDLVEGFRGRWVGVYADPNHMAMNLVIVVPLAVAFLVRRDSSLLLRIVAGAAAGLAVAAIVVSHSRGGFIGLCVAMGIWALRERERRIQAFVGAALLAVGLLFFAPKSFWQRNETVATFEQDASAMGRVYAWTVASRISLDKPMLGVGLGGFRFAWPMYAPPEARRAYVAHNIFLDVIGELGFVGLVLFLVFAGGAAGGAFAAAKHARLGWLSTALAASVSGYLVCSLFSGYTISAHLYVLFALAACSERIANGVATFPERNVRTALRPVAVEA